MQRDPEGIETRYLHRFVDFANARVLEIGCGEGRLIWRYADAAQHVVGIDPDVDRLAIASRECPPVLRSHVNFALATSETLPFMRETFDVAILGWSL